MWMPNCANPDSVKQSLNKQHWLMCVIILDRVRAHVRVCVCVCVCVCSRIKSIVRCKSLKAMNWSSMCSIVMFHDFNCHRHKSHPLKSLQNKQNRTKNNTTCISILKKTFYVTLNTTQLSNFHVAFTSNCVEMSHMSAHGKISVAVCTYVRGGTAFALQRKRADAACTSTFSACTSSLPACTYVRRSAWYVHFYANVWNLTIWTQLPTNQQPTNQPYATLRQAVLGAAQCTGWVLIGWKTNNWN